MIKIGQKLFPVSGNAPDVATGVAVGVAVGVYTKRNDNDSFPEARETEFVPATIFVGLDVQTPLKAALVEADTEFTVMITVAPGVAVPDRSGATPVTEYDE